MVPSPRLQKLHIFPRVAIPWVSLTAVSIVSKLSDQSWLVVSRTGNSSLVSLLYCEISDKGFGT